MPRIFLRKLQTNSLLKQRSREDKFSISLFQCKSKRNIREHGEMSNLIMKLRALKLQFGMTYLYILVLNILSILFILEHADKILCLPPPLL